VSIRAVLADGTLAGLTNDVEDVAVAMRYSTKFVVTEDGRCGCLWGWGTGLARTWLTDLS